MSEQDTLPALPEQDGVEFRHVVGWPGYCVSDGGDVMTCFARTGYGTWGAGEGWRVKPSTKNRYGYRIIQLNRGGNGLTVSVHKLILEAFVGPCPPGMEACHENGDRSDNRLSNLRWDTPKANAADRERHGRTARGERSGPAKLSNGQVKEALEMRKEGYTLEAIGRRFGVTKQAVRYHCLAHQVEVCGHEIPKG